MKLRKIIIPIGPSIGYVELTRGKWALIDSDDAERVGCHNWHSQPSTDGSGFYARSNIGGHVVKLHRFILELKAGEIGDHVHGATLDYRKDVLRRADYSQNAINRKLRSDNVSGVKGVSWYKRNKKWGSNITVNGKQMFLGLRDSKEEAVSLRMEAEKIYHGDYRRAA